jgi:hypothetical protein
VKPTDSEIQAAIGRLFDRFERMTDAELLLLRSVWSEQDATAREQAWTTAKATLRARRRDAMLGDARDRLASWVNNYPASMVIGDVPASFQGSGMDPGSIRKAAIPPMLDAIAATIAADGLSPNEQTLLLEPLAALAPHSTPG